MATIPNLLGPATKMRFAIVALVGVLGLLSGCASTLPGRRQELQELRDLTDGRTTEISDPVGLPELLDLGVARHPDVLTARIDLLRAKLDQDKVAAAPLPRLFIEPRVLQSPLAVDNNDYYGLSAPLSFSWDVLRLWTGKYEALAAVNSEDAAGIQLDLARVKAASDLASSYYAYWIKSAWIERRDLDRALRRQDERDLAAGFELGEVSRASLSAQRISAIEQQRDQRIAGQALDYLTTRMSAAVGAASNIQLRPPSPTDGPDVDPMAYSFEQCRQRSGMDRADALYLENANWFVDAAKLAKWSKFRLDFSVGNIINWKAGYIEVLLSWLIPLVDQGDNERRVLRAELSLIEYLVQRHQELDQYRRLFNDRRRAVIEQQAALRSAELAYTPEPGPETDPQARQRRRLGALTQHIANLQYTLARIHLTMLCSQDPADLLTTTVQP